MNPCPLACKTSYYVDGHGWTWPDVALMPVVVGSPFGSPISLAPLNFNKHEPCLKLVTAPATATPGAIDALRSPRPPELDVGATGGIGAL